MHNVMWYSKVKRSTFFTPRCIFWHVSEQFKSNFQDESFTLSTFVAPNLTVFC